MKKLCVFFLVLSMVFGFSLFAVAASKNVVLLMPSTTNNYLAEYARGFDDAAKALGYKVMRIENNFKQEEQDVQVQQQLAAKEKPAAYVWWPADNAAGLASLRALANTGVPVVMTNQLPIKGNEKLWVAYAGVDDILNGFTAGQMMVEARDKLKAAGHKFHSPGGNCIAIRFPIGYSAGDDRVIGFKDAIKDSGIQILDVQPAGFDETTGYDIGAKTIAANRAKGIDLAYANNDALITGVIQALEEAGFKPGQDVMAVGGTCHGNTEALRKGKQYASGLQAARLEGYFTMQTVHKYLLAGKTEGDVYRAPADPDKAPPATGVPAKYNFIPNPAVHANEIDKVKLWGFTFPQLCTY